MTALAKHLHVLTYAYGFTGWLYKDFATTLAEMADPDFLTEISDMLTPGDVLRILAKDGVSTAYVQDNHTLAPLVPFPG